MVGYGNLFHAYCTGNTIRDKLINADVKHKILMSK